MLISSPLPLYNHGFLPDVSREAPQALYPPVTLKFRPIYHEKPTARDRRESFLRPELAHLPFYGAISFSASLVLNPGKLFCREQMFIFSDFRVLLGGKGHSEGATWFI